MCEMRSSVIFLSPLLARLGMAEISAPGGCEIGLRPIDLHLSSLRLMGAQIETEGGVLSCRCPDGLHGEKITLSFPSVGATENILIAAASADGETVILNAAREPEIADLADFLCSCGAHISGAGSGEITVCGMKKLHSAEHTVIPDRIIASTYMAAAAVTGGDVRILDTRAEHITPVIPVFEQAGCKVDCGKNSVHISAPVRLRSVQTVRTMPYPGFPTDSQAAVMAMLSVAHGTSVMIENIFENRYRHVRELCRLGADIMTEGKVAVIKGVETLTGACVCAADLRAGTGAAPVIARIAKDMGILTVGVVTRPFKFEGKKKQLQAQKGIENLAENVDSLIVIPNEQLKAMNNGQKMTFVEAFKMADEVLLHGVKSISELIKVPGFVNLDFADVTSIMKDAGYAHMGFAKASGKDKAAEAAKGSISSPLLETSISGAKGVIISFTAAPDVDLDDIEGAAALITEQAHPDADITWGIAFDDSMDDEMMITVIATGFEDKPKSAMYPEEQPKAEAPAAPAAQTEYVQTSIAQPAKPVAPEEPKKEDAPYIAKRPAEINPDDEFSIILDSFNR